MIQIENCSFAYRKKNNLFSSLNLELEGGSIYGLLGKNGAGKTTLLKLIAGLLFPKEGNITVFGNESRLRLPDMLSEICFIPEEFNIPSVTTELYRALYAPLYPRFSEEDFTRYLKELELDPEENLSSMSYGQKKKFQIAFGLATNCSLFILDEPTNGLDIPSKSQFRKLLASTLTDDRLFLISTHQVRDMQNLIDPIVILDEGEVIFKQDAFQVARKLTVKIQDLEPDPAAVLYVEKVLGGYAAVQENTDGSEVQVDVELLFNAVINNRDKVQGIFTKEEVKK